MIGPLQPLDSTRGRCLQADLQLSNDIQRFIASNLCGARVRTGLFCCFAVDTHHKSMTVWVGIDSVGLGAFPQVQQTLQPS